VVLGTVIPTLIKTQDLGFDAVGATYAATISLVGVGIGAIMGPAVTGTLVAAGIAYPWGFYAFAAAAVIAVVALVTVPHTITLAPGGAAAVGRSPSQSPSRSRK
jgi:hypothetical protein